MARVKPLIVWSIRLFFLFLLAGVITITVTWLIIAPSLPSVDALREVRLQVPLRIYTADGRLIAEMGEQRRQPVDLESIPKPLVQAFLAAEDDRFYAHPGVDWRGTARAVWLYATSLGRGRVPGGSTITQQVARRFYLSTEYSVTRKLREMMLALRIEEEMSKDEILELYLNKEFLGHRAYGVAAAARVYYGKSLDELTLAEAAMIAGLPKAPSRVNPITSPRQALERRAYVLGRMLDEDFIDRTAYEMAMAAIDNASYHGLTTEVSAPWVAEMARLEAVERLGAEEAYSGGYTVITTLDTKLQRTAQEAVRTGLLDYDRRHGWRGPEDTVGPEILDDPEALGAYLSDTGTIAGLVPGIVLRAGTESAEAVIDRGEIIELGRDGVAWARPFVNRNAVGAAPTAVEDVVGPGDVIRLRRDAEGVWHLAQIPEAQSALVSLDPNDGALLALVGGMDYSLSQFNRATQSRRQPGSAFKPFIYAAALDRGYTPATLVNDAPVVIDDPSMERIWKPRNFSERFYGPTRLREAMVNSRNLVSVRLLMGMGLEYARDYITDFGFDREHLPAGLSMALGSASLSPMEIATAYAVFASGGYAVRSNFIHAIRGPDDDVVWEPDWTVVCRDCPAPRGQRPGTTEPEPAETMVETAPADAPPIRLLTPANAVAANTEDEPAEITIGPPVALHGPPVPEYARQVLSPQTTYLIRSMMEDVIRSGTGRRALALERTDLAGKTGTTNDQRDTWFVGFNNHLVTAVWVGLDSHESLGGQEQGGRTALPIWVDFMDVALEDVPETRMTMPPRLARVRIDPETGLRARPGNPNAIEELFHADNVPPLEPASGSNDEENEDPYEIF